jgi:Fe-S cluster assembly protein SufD
MLVDFVRETVVEHGAKLNLSEITRMSARSAIVCGNYVRQNRDSRADMINVWLRGGVTRINSVVDLAESGCESNLYGLWFATGAERVDVNVRVNHLVPDCSSFELIKGIASDEAVGVFTGLVHVARGAQRTVALQQSRNLLMSENARIHTEPQLEIYADDVKCSHGATVGQMDGEAIFYMRQRGIGEEDARRLQMFGFVNDIISRCSHTDTCNFMTGLAEKRIEEV